jgi:hypothetical protein
MVEVNMRQLVALALLSGCERERSSPPRIEPRPEWPPAPVELDVDRDPLDASPDARVLAWFDEPDMHLLDLWTGEETVLSSVSYQPLAWSLDGSLLAYVRGQELFALHEGEQLPVGLVSDAGFPPEVARDGSALVFEDERGEGVLWRPDGSSEDLGPGSRDTQVDPRSGLLGWRTPEDTTVLLRPDGPVRELPGWGAVSATGRAAWHDYETVHTDTTQLENDHNFSFRELVWSEGGETLAILTSIEGTERRGLMFLPAGAEEAQGVEGLDIPEWTLFSHG